MYLSIFISVINQIDAQNFCFTISLFRASTCFEHMCSKHVEAWNKIIVKQKFCASSWLITEISVLYCSHSSQNILAFKDVFLPALYWKQLDSCAKFLCTILCYCNGRINNNYTGNIQNGYILLHDADVVSVLLRCYTVLPVCLTLKTTALLCNVRYSSPTVGRDSSVGIATSYWLDGPGTESRWGRDFLHPSRP